MTLPKHLAIIMDGNGRWAKQQRLTRLEGHRAGAQAAQEIVRYCGELHIPFLTLYAFSSENWQRPKDEVSGLMRILENYLKKECDELIAKGVRVGTIGAVHQLPNQIQKALQQVCQKTANGNRLRLTLALSYGARDELARATKAICTKLKDGLLKPEDIDEALLERHLDTSDLPDPDLFIRTSGVKRLSNFLLWQLSYAELHFTPVLWPAFSRADIDIALADFAGRERRFGKTSEQLKT